MNNTQEKQMAPIAAFWHRSCKTFVPLTLADWERRSPRLPGATIRALMAAGMVEIERGEPPIYELTPEGKEHVRAILGIFEGVPVRDAA